MHRRADIEGLRAVAVLVVLLFHAGVPWLGGGYVGVDVFFVVSGYLITGILLRERAESGRVSLSGFWSRRARRILPMSALVAVATLVASWIWLEPTRVRDAATDAIGVATFSANLVFADRGADYLQSAMPPSPFQHYWSLAVEEQFYVVWPLLVVLVCLGAAGAPAVRRRIGLLAAAVTVASFTACMVLMESSQPWAFFAPHTRRQQRRHDPAHPPPREPPPREHRATTRRPACAEQRM
ncbi:MAG: acyltransferase family protein, partial [Actinomycetota bacterium]